MQVLNNVQTEHVARLTVPSTTDFPLAGSGTAGVSELASWPGFFTGLGSRSFTSERTSVAMSSRFEASLANSLTWKCTAID